MAEKRWGVNNSTVVFLADFIRSVLGTTDPIPGAQLDPQLREAVSKVGSGGGGGSLPAGVYFEVDSVRPPNKYYQRRFFFNGETYVYYTPYAGNGNSKAIDKYVDGAWTPFVATTSMVDNLLCVIEFNGKLYFYGNEKKSFYTLDDSNAFARLNDIPNNIKSDAMVVFNGRLYAYSYYDGGLYVYDEASDSWTKEATLGVKYDYFSPHVLNGELWFAKTTNVYKYSNGALEQKATLSAWPSMTVEYNNCIYFTETKTYRLRKYDPITGVETSLGTIASSGSNGITARLWVGDGNLRYTDNESSDATSQVLEFIVHVIEATE